MDYNTKVTESLVEYLMDMMWKQEKIPQNMIIINGIKEHLLSLASSGEVTFDFEKYSHVSSYISLQVFKEDKKIEEYFASVDDGILWININGETKQYVMN